MAHRAEDHERRDRPDDQPDRVSTGHIEHPANHAEDRGPNQAAEDDGYRQRPEARPHPRAASPAHMPIAKIAVTTRTSGHQVYDVIGRADRYYFLIVNGTDARVCSHAIVSTPPVGVLSIAIVCCSTGLGSRSVFMSMRARSCASV